MRKKCSRSSLSVRQSTAMKVAAWRARNRPKKQRFSKKQVRTKLLRILGKLRRKFARNPPRKRMHIISLKMARDEWLSERKKKGDCPIPALKSLYKIDLPKSSRAFVPVRGGNEEMTKDQWTRYPQSQNSQGW